MVVCAICGKPADLGTKWRRDLLHKTGRGYCSHGCAMEWRRRVSSVTMARTNRRYASERMRTRNPMHNPEVRKRMSQTKRGRPWTVEQGGNGRPPPVAQAALAGSLGWAMEVIVRTGNPPWGKKHRKGTPSHYKLDIAEPTLKIAIEVDGGSHLSLAVQAADARKEAFLRGAGWIVLRFTNQEVMGDLEACVQTVRSTISRLQGPTPMSQTAS